MMQYDWLVTVESDKYGPGSLWDKEVCDPLAGEEQQVFRSVFE
jgi:hypothetical protein